MNEPQNNGLKRLLRRLPLVVGLAALLLVIAYGLTFRQLPANEDPSAWGTFGDFLGGLLNPLVSTFTLFVAIEVWRQQEMELSETKAALKDQAKTAQANRREQRFFDLMRVYQQTLDTFQELLGGDPKNGKAALDAWMKNSNTLNSIAHPVASTNGIALTVTQIKDIHGLWDNPDTRDKFSHYFRVINRILRDAEDLLGEDRYKFIRLFRAQLSHTELRLIGLNLWLNAEGEKMRSVVEAYGLLKHLPEGKLRQQLEQKLSPAVFGRNFERIGKPTA